MDNCFYCEQGETLDKLMILIDTLEYSKVYLVRNQNFLGRTVVLFKDHVHEVFQLTSEQREGFLKELSAVADVIFTMFSADKINYAVYGDEVPHLHVHLLPKVKGGYCWGKAPLLAGGDNFPSAKDLENTAKKMQQALIEKLEP